MGKSSYVKGVIVSMLMCVSIVFAALLFNNADNLIDNSSDTQITAYEFKIVAEAIDGRAVVYYSNEPPQAGPNSIMFLDALTNQVKILITPKAIITKNTPIPTE